MATSALRSLSARGRNRGGWRPPRDPRDPARVAQQQRKPMTARSHSEHAARGGAEAAARRARAAREQSDREIRRLAQTYGGGLGGAYIHCWLISRPKYGDARACWGSCC